MLTISVTPEVTGSDRPSLLWQGLPQNHARLGSSSARLETPFVSENRAKNERTSLFPLLVKCLLHFSQILRPQSQDCVTESFTSTSGRKILNAQV